MSFVRAGLVRPALVAQIVRSSLISSGSVIESITRTFIELDPVLQSHYVLNTPFVATGDFEIKFRYAGSSGAFASFLGSSSGARVARLESAGNLRVFIGSVYAVTSTPINDGLEHWVLIKRSGEQISTSIDGVVESVATDAGVTAVDVGTIGGLLSSSYVAGVFSLPKFTDLSNPANNQTYKLDQATGDIEYAEENVLGDELWSNDSIVDNQTTHVVNGSLVTVTTKEEPSYDKGSFIDLPTVAGAYYIVSSTINNKSIKSACLHVTDSPWSFNARSEFVEQGENREVQVGFTANTALTRVSLAITDVANQGGISVEFDNISVREVSASLIYVNIPESNRDTYEFTDDGWLGDGLVVNGGFDSDGDWTKGAGWEIANGVATSVVGDSLLYQAFDRPARYLLTVDKEESPELRYYNGVAYRYIDSDAGTHSYIVDNQDLEYTYLTFKASSGAGDVVKSVEIQRLIEVAQ